MKSQAEFLEPFKRERSEGKKRKGDKEGGEEDILAPQLEKPSGERRQRKIKKEEEVEGGFTELLAVFQD